MAQFLTAAEFRRQCFAGSPPTLRTVISWVDRGLIPGYRMGRHVYVDVSRIESGIGVPSTGDADRDREADALADKLLEDK